MRRTTCRKVLEVFFFALFLAGVEGAPLGSIRIEPRQPETETSGMIKTITKTNNEAGQTLTETCYFWPATPDVQDCSTTVTWTTDEDRTDDGSTNTIWPDPSDNPGSATMDMQQANPTSDGLPTALYPTTQAGESSRPTSTIAAAVLQTVTAQTKSQVASDLVIAQTQISSAAPADRSAAASDQDNRVAIKPEDSDPFPGQHLAVLPIGLGIYCSLMGLALVVVFYMTLVRMRFRREYRQRKKGVGMGLGVVMGVGMGLEGRFAASEVRSA